MLRPTNQFVLLVVTLTVFTGWQTSAFAYTVQEKYVNTLPDNATAYALLKIMEGKRTIPSAIHHEFAKHKVAQFQLFSKWYTAICFYSGDVAPDEWTWACFNTASGIKPKVLMAVWLDKRGKVLGKARDGYEHVTVSIGAFLNPDLIVEVANHWTHWEDPNDTGWLGLDDLVASCVDGDSYFDSCDLGCPGGT